MLDLKGILKIILPFPVVLLIRRVRPTQIVEMTYQKPQGKVLLKPGLESRIWGF